MQNDKMLGSEALIRALEMEKVEYMFGISGHGNMHILDVLDKGSDIKFMLTRHEQGAVHIADGYARVKNKIGVCCTSVGAGAANLVMGLGTAAGGSSPVMAINGGIISKWYGRGQLQSTERPENKTDQCYSQVVQPLVKKAWTVENCCQIPEVVHRACTIATSGRPGPVSIEIPWDVQAQEDSMEFFTPEKHSFGKRIRADFESTKKAVELLLKAKCPVIVCGNGVEISDAGDEVRQLAELLGAPIASSLMAKGSVPENHPLSVRTIGWLGHPVAHEYIREYADLVLAVGFRFGDQGTSFWSEGYPFVKENKFIQIDIIPQEIGRYYPVEVGLLGDAKAVLTDLINVIPKSNSFTARRKTVEKRLVEMFSNVKLDMPNEDLTPMEPVKAAGEIRRVLPDNSILAIDTGQHAHYFTAFYPVYGHRRYLCPGSWTPMGWSPAAIIGAKLAELETPCVCVTGDGGFFMMCQEVITAVEWNVPVVWIVFNNQTLNAIRLGQKADYDGHIIGTEFKTRANFAALAKSLNAEGIRVEKASQVAGALDFALKCGKPCVLDLVVETDPITLPFAGDFYTPGRHPIIPKPRGVQRELLNNFITT
ncbi:MAG: thiamine pyrophosphate-binding protein [Spirochaetales bacterium]|nr:thiamine pyrophosphate-binding protein [Spirochaetales bacterium]